jgi:hypothetical protein
VSIPSRPDGSWRRYHPLREAVKSIPDSNDVKVAPSTWTRPCSPFKGGSWKLPVSSRFEDPMPPAAGQAFDVLLALADCALDVRALQELVGLLPGGRLAVAGAAGGGGAVVVDGVLPYKRLHFRRQAGGLADFDGIGKCVLRFFLAQV